MRKGFLVVLGAVAVGCSDYPDEGEVIENGPGVIGVPGGPDGVRSPGVVPISGGTLLVARDGRTAVAADPDRDKLWIADLAGGQLTHEVAFEGGDEPGRMAEDGHGRVHVGLRRGGALASIELAGGKLLARRAICPAPRGVAWEAAPDVLHVACDTGELVSLRAGDGTIVRKLDLGRDLRDVVVQGSRLLVSRFRTAELLVVEASGEVSSTLRPRDASDVFAGSFVPGVAWRMVVSPSGGIKMIHQRATDGVVLLTPQGYYSQGASSCSGSLVEIAVSDIDPDRPAGAWDPAPPALPRAAGMVDMAVSPAGQIAVVLPGGSWASPDKPVAKLLVIGTSALTDYLGCVQPEERSGVQGEPVAVAYDGQGRIVVQSREPAQIQVMGGPVIRLSDEARGDTGLALFHRNTGTGVACVSCHPEGRDDGRVWSFDGLGQRRTQSSAGGVIDSAPFHWSGDLQDFPALVHEVGVSRMGGPRPNQPQLAIFEAWMNEIPAPLPRDVDPDAAARGRALFESAEVGCGDCHHGPQRTSRANVDVGTGGALQVPRLRGVGARAPFLHNGCAATLRDRFGACGGGDAHGKTSGFGEAEIDDLVAFLETL